MVESNAQGDGVNRPVQYAKFRTDKPATPGYSQELVNINTPVNCYDDFSKYPMSIAGCDTLLKHFQRLYTTSKNQPMLGSRKPTGEKNARGQPIFGEYEWQTYGDVHDQSINVAKALRGMNLCPEIQGDNKSRRFLGIWSKNRAEWMITLLAAMRQNTTVIGFFDAMGPEAVDFIIKQTELETIFASGEYIKKVIEFKKSGFCQHVKHIVNFDNDTSPEMDKEAAGLNLVITEWHKTQALGAEKYANQAMDETLPTSDYMFSYTSGTTGDPKGVKLNHTQILTVVDATLKTVHSDEDSRVISYLPYPHSFEQCMLGMALVTGCKVGYYSGNPAMISEDCQKLRPTLFPSVPRLYQRIYASVKTKVDALTGCAKWLADKAYASKAASLAANAEYSHACYDMLVFNKMKAAFGGALECMVTGSAPIDLEILAYLKVCFSCPLLEGYGLTETAGASTITKPEDPVPGHVGGPLECCKFRLRDVAAMNYHSTDKPYPRGEICMQGSSVTEGYYKCPEKTKEAFDAEGWFLSGDVGMIYPNGSVKVIDRVKNIFKLSHGEYIAPEKLENKYALSDYVAQILIYGDSLKNCCVAIIVLEQATCFKWAAENGKAQDLAALALDADMKKVVQDSLNIITKEHRLSGIERPHKLFLTHDAFSIENNILTPTFKLKRNVARDVYKTQIDAMYKELAAEGK